MVQLEKIVLSTNSPEGEINCTELTLDKIQVYGEDFFINNGFADVFFINYEAVANFIGDV